MFVRLLLVVTLSLLPSVATAEDRPTPALVAAAMLPCVADEGRIPVEVRATVVGAEFWEYPEHTMQTPGELAAIMYRGALDPEMRESRAIAYLDDDPSPFPLLLDLSPAWRMHLVTDARFRYPDCFRRVYHP